MIKIAVIGSGYVGLVAAACFAELGHKVTCVDSDAAKVSALQQGESPIHEEFVPILLKNHIGNRLTATTDLDLAVREAQVIFIAVGTPPLESGDTDLSFVEAVSREIAPVIAAHPEEYKIIVEKSTVPVDTNRGIRRVIELNGARPNSFAVASNPEFLREGTAVTDFLCPDRIVIGADSEEVIATLKEIYSPLTDGSYHSKRNGILNIPQPPAKPRLIVVSAKSAELIKHAANAFLAMKISFINAVAAICESIGADIDQVREGIGTDSRIGARFLYPGIGYGGSCFPKDLTSFREVARRCGYDFRLLDEVMNINEDQRRLFISKVQEALWILKGKRLGVLGLAYKGGTDDIRESQAIAIIETLMKEGSQIVAYDPAASKKAMQSSIGRNPAFRVAENAYEAAQGADALLILTDWKEFAALDFTRLRSCLKYPIIIDGRNLYPPDVVAAEGFKYISVGRAEVAVNVSPQDAKIARVQR